MGAVLNKSKRLLCSFEKTKKLWVYNTFFGFQLNMKSLFWNSSWEQNKLEWYMTEEHLSNYLNPKRKKKKKWNSALIIGTKFWRVGTGSLNARLITWD